MKIQKRLKMNNSINKNNAYKDKISYFTDLAPEWDKAVGNDRQRIEKLEKLFQRINIGKGASVLDIGCGNGILIPLTEKKTSSDGKITAVDSSSGMINIAKQRHADHKNIDYITGIFEKLDLEENSFDTVLAFAAFPHIEDQVRALVRIRHCIKESGHLYIFHMAGTERLNHFHRNLDSPVKNDIMPGKREISQMLSITGFEMSEYIDRDDLNFIEAVPCLTS